MLNSFCRVGHKKITKCTEQKKTAAIGKSCDNKKVTCDLYR